MATDGREGEAAGGVGADERLDAIPEEQRDIMILRVFGASEERLGDRRALRKGDIGKRGSKFTAHLGGGLGLGEFGEGGHAGDPLLGDQADGPAAHGGIDVLERAGEERVVEEVRRLQHPERAKAAKRIRIRGQHAA